MRTPALGGTCLRIGCIPSKALLESSELYAEAKHDLAAHGIARRAASQLDLPAMLRRKDQVVTALTKGVEALFKKNKITRYLGHGRIAGPGRVVVSGPGGETRACEATHILIATGSKSATLPGVRLDGDRIGTSTEALSYTERARAPRGDRRRLHRPGAGLRLAPARGEGHRARVPRPHPARHGRRNRRARPRSSSASRASSSACRARSTAARRRRATAASSSARTPSRSAATACWSRSAACPTPTGSASKPSASRLDAKGRIPVDEHFATSAPGIYAIGDVIGGPMLAHKAEEEGIACVERLVTGYGHVNYDAIPARRLHPPRDRLRRQDRGGAASEAGIEYRKGIFPFRANGRARALGAVDGLVKDPGRRRRPTASSACTSSARAPAT